MSTPGAFGVQYGRDNLGQGVGLPKNWHRAVHVGGSTCLVGGSTTLPPGRKHR